MQWRQDGMNVKTELPEKLDIQKFYKGVNPTGTLVVKIVQAFQLMGMENNKTSSDPFVKIFFGKSD